ncbi:chaperone modulator CbpM [Caenimonas terrae]|uniref:Chaperone modulator CbpM n=1 Tax=Caenimonas terrae TaxID=696074 RepID=A0ABW0NH89_9BURK
MNPFNDRTWIDARMPLPLTELAQASGIGLEDLGELVDYGALVPVQPVQPGQPLFSAACIGPLREARSMRLDYDLDLFTMALLYRLLARIDTLERQVRSLQARTPAHLHGDHEGPQPWHEPHAGRRDAG